VESDDPVIMIEHKDAYLRKVTEFPLGTSVPRERYTVPLGRAAVVREGTDVTIATLSTMVERSLAAADQLAENGVSVEVIDLRTIVPLDIDTVVSSVARTRRLLVVDEDYRGFGLSGEVVTQVLERLGPSALRGLGRVANPDVPIPAALSLEQQVLPQVASIVAAARRVTEDGR
jgi:acetoin:2,6-dichlorophenolindophenol oxidoreductase subunit beta